MEKQQLGTRGHLDFDYRGSKDSESWVKTKGANREVPSKYHIYIELNNSRLRCVFGNLLKFVERIWIGWFVFTLCSSNGFL